MASRADAVEWWRRAIRLTGTSETTRRNELRELRAMPNLEATLRDALDGPRKPLALDAIVALPLPALVPDLLIAAEKDRTGIVDLALGALLSHESAAAITNAAENRLLKSNRLPAPPVQVVLLDLLGRLERVIPIPKLTRFLDSPSFEVRSAALLYVRSRLLHSQDRSYLALLDRALVSSPYQLRIQAIHTLRDLPEALRPDGIQKLSLCRADKNLEVRALCVAPPEETE